MFTKNQCTTALISNDNLKQTRMKFKFLAVVALTGMVFTACHSDKNKNGSDTLNSKMADTSVIDTARKDTSGVNGTVNDRNNPGNQGNNPGNQGNGSGNGRNPSPVNP